MHLATKHISFCQVNIPKLYKLYKRVTARSYSLHRLDGTMTDFQNIKLGGATVYIL